MNSKKRYDTHDTSGSFISQVNLTTALEQNIFYGERQGTMVLLSVKNETRGGGMLLIPKNIGSNGLTMGSMKVLLCQLHREVFLKSFTTTSSMKRNRRSDPPREALRGAHIQFKHVISCRLISFPRYSCAVCDRRDNPARSLSSTPSRRRCPGLRCDRCGPRDRRVATPRSG